MEATPAGRTGTRGAGSEVTRRFIAGLLIGLVVAVLEVILTTLGPPAPPGGIVGNAGGAMRLLAAGASLGAAYALLFRPTPGGHPENVMGGVVMGVVTWAVFALSLFPILDAGAPMWHVDTAGPHRPGAGRLRAARQSDRVPLRPGVRTPASGAGRNALAGTGREDERRHRRRWLRRRKRSHVAR